jgi:putative alpha-1,2-mannosidase
MKGPKSRKSSANLTRRRFLGAGSSAAAATILGPTIVQAAWPSRVGSSRQPVDEVDPFIGTTNPGLRWMLFPGAAMPFGMVKLSPDNKAWKGRAGSGKAGTTCCQKSKLMAA